MPTPKLSDEVLAQLDAYVDNIVAAYVGAAVVVADAVSRAGMNKEEGIKFCAAVLGRFSDLCTQRLKRAAMVANAQT